ncbi:GFA family protein [Paracoccus sp. R12_1]|uniref:GFA family protein n=1 Tax=unclassified Paracoccus (in: a-proteobacteria) TaxID=2688777 RepID=UPI001ADB4BEE|nr:MULTISPECIES: GFA family protein [unclassified Paracoccus (in: a-proteobacteria)]MBO9456138.1 GFA family protein [Paracoccus sp. R12_2]MBO9487045.1 GFA family protein [Paracoccus sp. R12_1]
MTSSQNFEIRGQCLCGAVRFSGRAGGPEVTACHCGQCRRWSGHVWASFHLDAPVIDGEALRWYQSSPEAERGFCSVCGTSLFWRPNGRETLSVSPGAIENPTGLRMDEHIYVADKGDYYRIADGLPQQDQ